MYTILYYSPTGNSKHLAQKMASLLEVGEVFALEKSKPEELQQNDELILMYPIHGFNPPKIVTNFVKKIHSNKFKKVHLVAVGCNDLFLNDAVSLGLRRILQSKNYDIGVDEILVMPITIVLKMKEDMLKQITSDAIKVLENVALKIKENQVVYRKVGVGARLIHTIGKLESPAARLFGLELHAKKGCTSCGICWNRCPMGNIKEGKKGKPKFGFKCSMCMRCIYECPEKVITPYISKFLPVKDGYDLKEIDK